MFILQKKSYTQLFFCQLVFFNYFKLQRKNIFIGLFHSKTIFHDNILFLIALILCFSKHCFGEQITTIIVIGLNVNYLLIWTVDSGFSKQSKLPSEILHDNL